MGVQSDHSRMVAFAYSAIALAASCSDGSSSDRGLELYSVTVIGKGSLLSKITAQGLFTVQDPGRGSDSIVVFKNVSGTDWGGAYQLRADVGGMKISLMPWLCPMLSEAPQAIEAGIAVTETRLIELNDDGVFWTNGRYGQSFPTTCDWYTSRASGRGVSERQDGPSLCTEADRKETTLSFESSNGRALATPEVCVAYRGAFGNGTVALSITNQHAPAGEDGFILFLEHCLEPNEAIPLKVDASEFLASDCPFETAALRVGDYSDGRPKVIPLAEGSWNIRSASTDRSGRHVSDVDLVFGTGAMRVHVQGYIDLPQTMTE